MQIAKLFVEIGANINPFKRGMREVDQSIESTTKKSSFLINSLSTATGLLVAQGVSKFAQFGKSIVDTGLEFNKLEENSTIAFETMLGGLDKANAFMSQLRTYAERTPFELPGLITITQKLKAFGFETERLLPMLTDIGDAVSGLGGSPELLNRISLALGQIRAKGKIQAEEILQLTEAGIPAWELLASKMGKTIPEVMELSRKGALEANQAINNLLEGMRDRFGGLMEKQSKTFSGLSSTFNDIKRNLASRLTLPWANELKQTLEDTINLLQSEKFQAFFEKLEKGSARLAATFFSLNRKLFGGLFGGLMGGEKEAAQAKKPILQMYDILGMLEKLPNKLKFRRFEFLDNFTIKETVVAVTGFIDALRGVGPEVDYWFGRMPRLLQPVAKGFQTVYEYIAGGGVRKTLTQVTEIFKGLGSVISKLVKPFRDAFGALFQQLRATENIGFSDIFSGIIKALGQSLMGMLEVIKQEFWPTIKSGLVWLWNSISTWFTSIDWGSVWTSFTSTLSSLYDYIVGINWSGVWSNMLTGLSTIGSFLTSTVLPALSNFFSSLVSWFTDNSKRQVLLDAVTNTWNFISEPAGKLWGFVQPYLTSFWGWLTSWFTDTSKNQTLWNGIVSTWDFVTEWANKLFEWVGPPLGNLFSYLLSWFTDTSKRQTLWEGIKKSWGFVTEWAIALWDWIKPYLAILWTNLSSWFTDPTKRQTLWNNIKNTWTAVQDWGRGLWGWLQPKMDKMLDDLQFWIDTNYPSLGKWIDQVSTFTSGAMSDLKESFPIVSKAFSDLGKTIYDEVPKILTELGRLYTNLFGQSENSFFGGFAKFTQQITQFIGDTLTMFRMLLEMMNLMVESTKNLYSGNFGEWDQNMRDFVDKMNELWDFLRNTGQPQNTVGASSVTASNAPMVNQTVNISIDANARIDRQMVDYLVLELQRKLNNQGNRVAFNY